MDIEGKGKGYMKQSELKRQRISAIVVLNKNKIMASSTFDAYLLRLCLNWFFTFIPNQASSHTAKKKSVALL